MKDLQPTFLSEELVNKAWIHMREALDEQLPVQKKGRIVFLKNWKVAACLLFLLCGSLMTNLYWQPNQPLATVVKPSAKLFDSSLKKKNVLVKNTLKENTRKEDQNSSHTPPANHIETQRRIEKESLLGLPPLLTKLSSVSALQENRYSSYRAQKKVHEIGPTHFFPDTILLINKIQARRGPALSLKAGIQYSTSGNGNSLYPSLQATSLISKNIDLSIGMDAFAALDLRRAEGRQVSFLNDVASNVQFNVEEKKVQKAYYFNFPLEANYHIKERLTISTGIQLSLLQGTKTEKEQTNYDFGSDPAVVVSSIFSGFSTTSTQTYTEKVQISKRDLRFLMGITYKMNPFSLQLKYQHGMRNNFEVSRFDGEVVKAKSRIISLGFIYQIF